MKKVLKFVRSLITAILAMISIILVAVILIPGAIIASISYLDYTILMKVLREIMTLGSIIESGK